MDKLDKIFDIIDHPEKYTEKQINEILCDEESQKLYQSIVEADGALAADEARHQKLPDIDQEWNRINRKTTRYSLGRKVAAIVAIVFAVSGITLAAIQWQRAWRQTNPAPQHANSMVRDSIRTSAVAFVPEADSLGFADTVTLALPPLAEANIIEQELPSRPKDSLLAVETTDISQLLQDFYQQVAQEKIYLQTDRPYYAAGDTVWFRAHVADALTNIPSTSPIYSRNRSRYVYVELHDNVADSLVVRHKVLQDSLGAFANAIGLSPELPSGRYTLVAYTRWMQNFSQQNFAYQTLDIIGAHDRAPKSARHSSRHESAKASLSQPRLLVRRNGSLTYITPTADDRAMLDSLMLVVYGGGSSFTIDHLDGRTLQLNTDGLPSGRNSIALVKGRTVLDEHVLVVDHEQTAARLELKQEGRSSRVVINARPGIYALSVCDGSIVRDDSSRLGIKEALLTNGGMTLRELLSGQTKIRYWFEREQVISGRVTGLFRKPKNAKLVLLCQPTGQIWHFELGDNQRFRISGLEYTDGTRFTIEATNSKGGSTLVGLELDEDKYLAPKLNLPAMSSDVRSEVLTDDVVRTIRTRSHLDVWKTVQLHEVSVSGRRLKPMNRYGISPWVGATHGDSILAQSSNMRTLLHRFGLRILSNDRLAEFYGGTYIQPRVFLNDMEVESHELEWIMNLNPSAIKQIEYFPCFQNAMVNREPVGVLYIFVDWKVWERTMSKKSFVVIQPLGTMPSAVFPAQGSATTLYWNPIVVVGEDGKAEISFPAHSAVKEYNIHLEGISHDGEIISTSLSSSLH